MSNRDNGAIIVGRGNGMGVFDVTVKGQVEVATQLKSI